MSYELRREESLGEGLRRICKKQVELALAIARGEKETDDTPVHETRKHIKKARATLRLVRREIGRGHFKKQDHCLRDAGRLISDVRDAEVRLQTIRQLQSLTGKRQRKHLQVEQMLAMELENFVAAFAEWQTQAIPMLEAVVSEIDCWPVDRFDCKQLRRAIRRSYKVGRDALAEARNKKTRECFHEFRRTAKQLAYQLHIIHPINPVVLDNLESELRALSDLLGRAHDLGFLADRLRQEKGGPRFDRERHQLLAVIEAIASDLQRGAADLADRFFAERPPDFGRRLASWLNEWNRNKSSSLAEELVNDSGQPATVA